MDTQPQPLTKDQLAALLREAEHAHGQYESQLGHRDDDWPDWYAAYIVSKLQEQQPQSQSQPPAQEPSP
jgi:hypothetical protein